MSIWIFNRQAARLAAALICAIGLSGCEGGSVFGSPPERITVTSKSIVIAGPSGYCVDRSASRDSASGAFVLLGSCASIANNARASKPAKPGILTASISDDNGTDIDASLDQLTEYFKSDAGRAAVAHDGVAASVKILATRRTQNAFYVHMRDTSRDNSDRLADDYWRGVFDISGRIVTVTVIGFIGKPMTAAEGLATLNAFASRIRRENPEADRV